MAEDTKRGAAGSEAQRTARGEELQTGTSQPVSAAEVAKSLSGIDYPATKEDLKKHAEQKGARDELIQRIDTMAEKEYTNMADVEHEFGQAKRSEPET